MSIELGSGSINEIRLGATEIKKVYLGSNLIYDKTFSYLYDIEPFFYGISAARQLKSGQTLVERDRRTDNTEADISFIANEKTLSSPSTIGTTLGGFVGGGDAFIDTPYDQSGNGFVVEQTVANDQPLIVDSGALVTSGIKPAWDNSNGKGWQSSASASLSDADEIWMFFIVDGTFNQGATAEVYFETTPNVAANSGSIFIFVNAAGFIVGLSTDNANNRCQKQSPFIFPTGRTLLSVKIKGTGLYSDAIDVWFNGSAIQMDDAPQGSIFQNDPNGFANDVISVLSRSDGANPTLKNTQEFLIYKGDQSANRAAIEANINAYYNIY